MKMETLDELQLYVNLLETQKNKKYTDYELLVKDLKYEFNIDVSLKQIRELYEPTVEEDSLDKQILYNNIFN